MQPFVSHTLNNSCFIFPRAKIPNGLLLTYETCPEHFDNSTLKLVKYCCFMIIYGITQKSNYKKAQDWLRDYSSSLLVIPSVLFNVLALIVLNRFHRLRNYSQTSTTFYMKSMCVLDTLTIVSKFLHEIVVVRNAIRSHPIVITSFTCKFLFFFESACSISAIAMLIAMSIDKLICVLIPLKVNMLLTSSKAKIVVTCIIFVSAIISSYELIAQHAVELQIKDANKTTDQNDLEEKISGNFIRYDCDASNPGMYEDWILFNHIIKVFLPILIICLCNTWIVIELARSGRDLTSNEPNSNLKTIYLSNRANKSSMKIKVESDSKQVDIKSMDNVQDELEQKKDLSTDTKSDGKSGKTVKKTSKKIDRTNSNSINGEGSMRHNWAVINIRRRNTTQHISIMLFAVSFGFVILNLPFAIKTIYKRHFSKNNQILDHLYHSENFFESQYSKTEIKDQVIYEFYSNLTHILLDLNYTANFFFYFLAGSRFRAQLFSMFKSKRSADHINHRLSDKKELTRTPTLRIKFINCNNSKKNIAEQPAPNRNSDFD